MDILKRKAVGNKARRKRPLRVHMVVKELDGTQSIVEPFNRETQRLRAEEAMVEPGFMGPAAEMYQQERDMADVANRGIRRLGQSSPIAGFKRLGKNK